MKKKILGALSAFFAAALVLLTMAMAVYAEDNLEDVEIDVSGAVATNGKWGQSLVLAPDAFSATRFTPSTQVLVEYKLDGDMPENMAPVEFIIQNYIVQPQIWAKVTPTEYDEDSAVFDYDAIVAAYGSDDFSEVGNLCVGDCSVVLTVTKMTITNCSAPAETAAASTEVSEEVTEEISETQTEAITEAVATEGQEETEKANPAVIVIIVIVAVVAVAAVVMILIIKGNRRRFY